MEMEEELMANFNTDININPDRSLKVNQKPRVLTAKYGDGYEQRTGSGINTDEEEWDLKWTNRTFNEGNKIIKFFEDHAGVTSFDWYPEGYQISSTATGTNTDKLIDTNSYFTNRYLNATVSNTTDSTTAVVEVVDSGTQLSLSSDIMASGESYTIYPYKKYICSEWTSTIPHNGVQTITAKFKKVFEP